MVFSALASRVFRLSCCRAAAVLVLLQAPGVWAEEPTEPPPTPSPTPERMGTKPSAVVLKQYRCQGGKKLTVRYQLGERSVHAFVRVQGKTRELPWDGDYKLDHEEDERFSDGRYEILVQGNFSRVSALRRLPSKAGGKARDLLRACSLAGAKAPSKKPSKAPAQLHVQPSPSPKPSKPTATPEAPVATPPPGSAL